MKKKLLINILKLILMIVGAHFFLKTVYFNFREFFSLIFPLGSVLIYIVLFVVALVITYIFRSNFQGQKGGINYFLTMLLLCLLIIDPLWDPILARLYDLIAPVGTHYMPGKHPSSPSSALFSLGFDFYYTNNENGSGYDINDSRIYWVRICYDLFLSFILMTLSQIYLKIHPTKILK